MNTVEPIRDIEVVKDIAQYLKERSMRDYVMFMFGIYSGLRISDILKLRVRDVQGQEYIYMRETKTRKERRFPVNQELAPIISQYTEGRPGYEYLLKSRKGRNRPIERQQAYKILDRAAKRFGLAGIGTHTLRKTFGYHMYQQTKDIVTIKEILNHSSIDVTYRYIGITQDLKDKRMKQLTFK